MNQTNDVNSEIHSKRLHKKTPHIFQNICWLIQIAAGLITLALVGSFATHVGRTIWLIYGFFVLNIARSVYPGFLGLPSMNYNISLTTFHVMAVIAVIGCILSLIFAIWGSDEIPW